MFECKASETARVGKDQQKFFDDLKDSGGTIVGDGKPTFEGGLVLPPTPMQIERKRR
jgi:filamentous hemagglutinin